MRYREPATLPWAVDVNTNKTDQAQMEKFRWERILLAVRGCTGGLMKKKIQEQSENKKRDNKTETLEHKQRTDMLRCKQGEHMG